MKNEKKIAVGLSGGVDSSVAALLLKQQRHDVIAVHMKRIGTGGGGIDAKKDEEDARLVAKRLDVPFVVVDFRKEYKEKVIKRFLDEFQHGLTPNPDIWCNEVMKFGLFLDYALNELGADKMATGHYARVIASSREGDGSSIMQYELLAGIDKSKDQSYFLYRLTQHQLGHALFPLGGLRKSKVRELAKQAGLLTARKKDSVGVCFIGDVDMREYLRKHLDLQPGLVRDVKGEVVGTHEGVQLYTIGQRHGFNMTKYRGIPMYVVDKDVKNNVLIVGRDSDSDVNKFYVSELHWILPDNKRYMESGQLRVRIRHLGKFIPCSVGTIENDKLLCHLESPQRGVASGQHAVFYLGDVVLGGGVIVRV